MNYVYNDFYFFITFKKVFFSKCNMVCINIVDEDFFTLHNNIWYIALKHLGQI